MLIWQHIALRLKREIRLGLRKPGALLPTEVQLASELGVCRKTLRRAFEELELAGLINRCKHVGTCISSNAEETVQVPLRIGVIFSVAPGEEQHPASWLRTSSGPLTEIHYLIRRFIGQGDQLQLLSDQSFTRDPDLWQKFDGLLFSPPQGEALALQQAAQRRFPHINLENHFTYPGINTVMADDEQAAYDCTLGLLREGHRKIAFIGGALQKHGSNCGFRRRTSGYLRALADFSLSPNSEWIFNVDNQDRYLMSELLCDYPVRSRDCTAVVAAVGVSVLELEKLRRLYGEGLYPQRPLLCVDLTPLHVSVAELEQLQSYGGFFKPRQKVASLAYENLMQWIGHSDYQVQCQKVPFLSHIPALNHRKEVVYAEF